METTSDRNLLSSPISIMNKIGFFNHNNTVIETIILAAVISGSMLVVIVSTLQYFFIGNDVNDLVSNLESTSGFLQAFGKVLVFIFSKKSFLKLIALSKQLWKIETMGSKEKQLKLNQTYQSVLRFQKVFYILASGLIIGVLLAIFSGRDLPVGIWKMDNYPKLHKIYKYTMNLVVIISGLSICTSDVLFIGICYTLIIQFQILCHKLEELNFDESQSPDDLMNQCKQFNICIEYHKFLLRYLNLIQNIYSHIFGIQYITSAPLVCVEIYAILDSGTNQPVVIIIRNSFTVLYVSCQLAFYCIPADLVVQEAITVANAIYNCNWFSSSNNALKKSLQIAIQASQREYQFTAWGMVEFKPATVLSVIKVAVSASTLLRQLETK